MIWSTICSATWRFHSFTFSIIQSPWFQPFQLSPNMSAYEIFRAVRNFILFKIFSSPLSPIFRYILLRIDRIPGLGRLVRSQCRSSDDHRAHVRNGFVIFENIDITKIIKNLIILQIKAACARIFATALDGKCEIVMVVFMVYSYLIITTINRSDSLYAGSTDINFVTTDLMECDLCSQARKARGL